MKTINVLVRDQIASAVGDIVYICGNSDYIINFDFDAEWDDYDVKTARFVHDGPYIDVVFTGNQCAMPVIRKAYGIYVVVYAGDLRTTTPAHIPSAASILSADGTPDEPPEDVYAQITALCEDARATAKSVRDDADAGKFNGAPGKTPVAGVDYFTEEDKQKIAKEAAGAVGYPEPTEDDEDKTLRVVDGKAKWEGALFGTTDELTPTQVYDAVKAGRPVVVEVIRDIFGSLLFTSFTIAETQNVIVADFAAQYIAYVVFVLLGDKSSNTWSFMLTPLLGIDDIPSVLPNPNPLTLKLGNEIVSYDGSNKRTVDVVEAVGFPQPTESDNGKFVGCEDGKAKWLPVEASGGGNTEETWELIDEVDCTSGDIASIEIALSKAYKAIMITNVNRNKRWYDSGSGMAILTGTSDIKCELTLDGNEGLGCRFANNGSAIRRQCFLIKRTDRTEIGYLFSILSENGAINSGGLNQGTAKHTIFNSIGGKSIYKIKIYTMEADVLFNNFIWIYGIPE